jgi:predicted DNA-binding protein
MGLRTTLTLEEDVMDRLRGEAQRTGRPFKAVVNEAIRAGLERRSLRAGQGMSYTVKPVDMGLKAGLELDDIEGLLDRLEGAQRR